MPVLSRGDEYRVRAEHRPCREVPRAEREGRTRCCRRPSWWRGWSGSWTSRCASSRRCRTTKLDTEVPNRPRSYRVLATTCSASPETFLEVAGGDALTYENLTARPPDTMHTTADIVAYGGGVRGRLAAWWDAKADKSGSETVQTYYGPQLLHEYLERTTWHVGQHIAAMGDAAGDERRHAERSAGSPPISPTCRCRPACGTGNASRRWLIDAKRIPDAQPRIISNRSTLHKS